MIHSLAPIHAIFKTTCVVIRYFIITGTFILVACLSILIAEDVPIPPRARVVRATDPQAVLLLAPHPQRVHKLLETAILKYANASDLATAWKRIVLPADRIGIKIHTEPGPVMATRQIVVEAVIDGLEMAGLKRTQIIIFDRYASQMESAGYPVGQRADGVTITATVPTVGYDPNAPLDIPIPGKLIWGDLEFKNGISEEEDQLSTKSHLTRVLTQEIDKMINIAVPVTDLHLGIYGCRLNASLSLIDNFRRLQRQSFTREDSLLQLFSNNIVQKKCVLHILDGLVAQYAAGPGFDPNYCWPLQTIYVSHDPIAIDALALQQINEHRVKAEIAPLKNEASYISAAANAGLGVADLSRIDVLDARIDH